MPLLNFSIKHTLAQALASSNLAKLFFTTDTNDVVIAGKNLTNNKGKEATIVQGMQSVVPSDCTNGIAAITKIQGATQKLVQLLGTTYVDMGLPSGTLWASCDIDVTKASKFCDSPYTYDKSFFSWGNVDGHNPTSESSFSPYDWGSVNQSSPYYEGQVYGSTKGNDLTGDIPVGAEYDAACVNLGAPWRMPTSAEYEELFNNIIYIDADGTEIDSSVTDKRVTINGIVGIYLQSTINGNRLFFACSGYGSGLSWYGRGLYGLYFSSTWISASAARRLFFNSEEVSPRSSSDRFRGHAIRPVMSNNNIYTIDGKKYAITDGMAFDLTAMGIEDLTSVADVKAWLLNQFGVNTGIPKTEALVSVLLKGIKSVGFNLWDESQRVDGYYVSKITGSQTENSDYSHTGYVRVLPSTTYYLMGITSGQWGAFYDANKNFISGYTFNSTQSFTTPANAAYVRISMLATDVSSNICINISNPSKNGTYEPHWDSLTEFDVTKISGIPSGGTEANREIIFPYGLQGIGDIRDVLSVANGVFSAEKKYIVVDLGSLEWGVNTTDGYFKAAVTNLKKPSYNTTPKMLCASYIVTTPNVVVSNSGTGISVHHTTGNIIVRDDSYQDATTFKNAMNGVYAVIELDNSVTYHDLKYNVSETSTPEWVSLPSLLFPVEEGGVTGVVPDNSTTIETCAPKMDIRYRVLPSDIFPFLNSRADKLLLTELKNMLGSKVEGAVSSISNRIAVFDGTTGKQIKDGGKTIDDITPTQIAITHSLQTDALAVTSVTNLHVIKVVHATLLQNTIVALNVSEGYDDEPCILSGVFVPGNALISVMNSQYTVTLTDGIPYILEVQIPEWDPAGDPFDAAVILIKALDGTIMYTNEP